MEEKPERVQKYVRVPVSERDNTFLSVIKDSVRKAVVKQLRDKLIILVTKLRHGSKL